MRRVGFALLSSGCLVATAVAAAWPTSPRSSVAAPTAPAAKETSSTRLGAQTAEKATSKAQKPGRTKCKPGELTLKAAECPKGARCRTACVPKPRNGASLLCPEGRVWKAMACPKGARCLVGGRCVTREPGKAGTGTKAVATKGASKATPKVVVGAQTKPAKVKCKVGRVATRVRCIRAPCDILCLPARFDPSLKASPKVKAL